jgi:hypothetical protein
MQSRQSRGRLHGASGVILILAAFLSVAPVRAQVAIGGKVGSLGLGLELTAGLSPQWNVRLGANGFNYTDDRRKAGHLEYDATAKLRTATALLDWHPGGYGFRLSGGVVYNDNRIDGQSLVPASGLYDIGGVPVPVSLVGTLDGRIDFDKTAGYAGLGWGNAVVPGRKLGFTFDAGVIFQGKAKVTLTPNIPASSPLNDPTARAALDILLRREEDNIQKDVADYTLYPVVSIGLTYRF